MDPQLRQLLKACAEGDVNLCINLIDANPDILLSTTPYKNNLLHISAMLGYDEFARKVWSKDPSLFSGTNIDGETPLITALMAANLPLATEIFTVASHYMQHDDLEEGFNRMLLMVDRCKENALHHAMRNGFQEFALKLLMKEPRLAEQVTNIGESPMYMAARRGYSDVVARLLEIPSSAVDGPDKESALHAAVNFNHPATPPLSSPPNSLTNSIRHYCLYLRVPNPPPPVVSPLLPAIAQALERAAISLDPDRLRASIVKQMLKKRPQLAYHKETSGRNPLHGAIFQNNLELVKLFLEYDPNLAYIKTERLTPFIIAVQKGFVSIAKEIMSVCPDSIYALDINGDNALMHAINFEKLDSFDYILKTSQVHRQINQANNNGMRPLHRAAMQCDPKLVRSLLAHKGQDYTAVDKSASTAVNTVYHQHEFWKTLKWNETFTLLSNEIPSTWKHEIGDEAKKLNKKAAIKEVKSLTKKYTSNTSLVAALLATITFAAAFSLPGGFSPDPTHAGLPVFVRKITFQLFLISDTIAMCSSLAVAFLCILATWEDLDFLLNYRKTTRVLMWCAYEATAVAFATGLFTVIAPNNLWLAIPILVFCTILPFISKIIGEWPLLMVRYRLGRLFRKDLVPNI
ncbi:uncharacterized protein LOC144546090 [Carex rostrata]